LIAVLCREEARGGAESQREEEDFCFHDVLCFTVCSPRPPSAPSRCSKDSGWNVERVAGLPSQAGLTTLVGSQGLRILVVAFISACNQLTRGMLSSYVAETGDLFRNCKVRGWGRLQLR
jgi:hypothetical protein